MNASWIDVLLNPALVTQGQLVAQSDVMMAVAYLFQGRGDEYEKRAGELGLPSLQGSPIQPAESAAGLLVQGLVRVLSNDFGAVEDLAAIARTGSTGSDLRAAACVLASIALRDAMRPQDAVDLISSLLETADDDGARALLKVHLSLAFADEGKFQDAVTTCEAVQILQGEDATLTAMKSVSSENAFQFRWSLGEIGRSPMPKPPWRLEPFAWINAVEAEVADELVEKLFESAFENPGQWTWQLSNQDRVSDNLAQALFRLECLGAWNRTRAARKHFARYRLLRSLTQPSDETEQALILLSMAGDDDGVRRAAGTLRARGPLEPLRAVGVRTANSVWAAGDVKGKLTLLQEIATLLDVDAADGAVERILHNIDAYFNRTATGGLVVEEALRALSSLSDAGTDKTVRRVARAFLEIAERPPDALLHQSLWRALAAFPWDRLPAKERREWAGYVTANLAARDDHLFVALGAFEALSELGARGMSDIAISSYRQSKSLYLAPMVLGHLNRDETAELVQLVSAAAQNVRDQAHAGSFAMHTVSPGALMGLVAVSSHGSLLRGQLIDYVLDPIVPSEERVSAARYLVYNPGKFRGRLRDRVSGGLPPARDGFPLFGPPEDVDVLNVELRAAFGTVPSDQLVASLLALSHSPSSPIRARVATAVRTVRSYIGDESALLLVGGLTWDADAQVRATAGRVIAEMAPFSGSPTWNTRLGQLLDESGEMVPLAVWLGLASHKWSGVPPKQLIQRAGFVSEGHLSCRVRRAARRFLAQVPNPKEEAHL